MWHTVSTTRAGCTRAASSTTDGTLDWNCAEYAVVTYDFNLVAHYLSGNR